MIPDFVDLPARKMTLPTLTYDKTDNKASSRTDPGTWDMTNVGRLLEIGDPLPTLCIIKLAITAGDGEIVKPRCKPMVDWLKEDFLATFKESKGPLRRHGFRTSRIKVAEAVIPKDSGSATLHRTETGERLSDAWKTLGKPKFVMTQLPKKTATIYANVKWWGDCHEEVRTISGLRHKFSNSMGLNMLSNFA